MNSKEMAPAPLTALASSITVSAALVLRPVKKMAFGPCFAKARIVSLPRPAVPFSRVSYDSALTMYRDLPPVMKITFPDRSGISLSGLYVVFKTILAARR
jgi:hypothetical protein